MRRSCLTLAALGLTLSGCSSLDALHAPPTAPRTDNALEDRDTVAAVIMANTFQSMQRLTQAGPAEQAEIVATAREAYDRSPQSGPKLRYALMLATPGHPARDPVLAQKLLRELAAQPETLLPLERAVGLVELAQLNRELGLTAENGRLVQGGEQLADRDRLVSASTQRRLQAEQDENTRLRKQLEDAQAKLDAIANIERKLTERKSAAEGGQP